MDARLLLTSILFASTLVMSACGPSQAERQATITQVAAAVFATQTAQAPTSTPTFTPSPTPTETPTSTPTLTATPRPSSTPTRTKTPTVMPTATPRLMALVLTPSDLPVGFQAMDPQQMKELMREWPSGSCGFAMADIKRAQVVMGFLMLVTRRDEQLEFDGTLQEFVQYTAALVGGKDYAKVDGMEDIGEARAAITFVGRSSSVSYRWEILGFRRAEVAAILFVAYPDGDSPAVSVGELARLLQARISQAGGLQAVRIYRK